MKSKRIYCDHNATTPVAEKVQKAYVKALKNFGNASSLYYEGRQARESVEQVTEIMANALGADVEQCLFCSSGTEANNQVLKHLIYQKVVEKKDVHLIISSIEHSSVEVTAAILEKYGIEVIGLM